MKPLKICFVTSEIHPFSKTGGLADVSGSLSRVLSAAGHDVRVFTPLYSQIDAKKYDFKPVEHTRDVPVTLGGRTITFSLKSALPPDSRWPVYFIDCPELYHRAELYTKDPDEHVRFAMFSRAVIESAQRMQWAPDVFHCHDWHASLTPLYLKTLYAWDRLFQNSRTMLTIHNIGYQGLFPSSILDDLSLSDSGHLFHSGDMHAGKLNFLKTGILWADELTTVSRTYAREIQTEEYGAGLHELLLQRSDSLVGIVNGVDYGEWDPSVDPHIPTRFSAKSLASKGKNKKALAQKLGIELAAGAPILGIVSRLSGQKGFDLCFDILPRMLKEHDFGLAVLGTGEPPIEEFFEKLGRKHPGRVGLLQGVQQRARPPDRSGQRHVPHAVPVRAMRPEPDVQHEVRDNPDRAQDGRPGGHRPCRSTRARAREPASSSRSSRPARCRRSMEAALVTWKDRKAWKRLVLSAMAQDFSWGVQVREYVDLYRKVASRRASPAWSTPEDAGAGRGAPRPASPHGGSSSSRFSSPASPAAPGPGTLPRAHLFISASIM